MLPRTALGWISHHCCSICRMLEAGEGLAAQQWVRPDSGLISAELSCETAALLSACNIKESTAIKTRQ